jgi:2-oxoisovalerate dehydrogenase E1 component alpha subunit
LATYLTGRGALTDDVAAQATARAEQAATALRTGLSQDVVADPADLFAHVYSSATPQLAEQADLVRDELSRVL